MSSLSSDLDSPAEASSTGSIRAFRESAPEVVGKGGPGRTVALVVLVLAVAAGAAWFVVSGTTSSPSPADAGAAVRAVDAGVTVAQGSHATGPDAVTTAGASDGGGTKGSTDAGPSEAGLVDAGRGDAVAPASEVQRQKVVQAVGALRAAAGDVRSRGRQVASVLKANAPGGFRRLEPGGDGSGGEAVGTPANLAAGGEGDAPATRPSGLAALDQGKAQVQVADPRALRPELLPDTLDQAQISAVLAQSRSGVRACFERQLKRDPSMDRARVTLGFEVWGDGTAHNVRLDREIDGTVLEGCLTGMVRRWRFPRFSGAPIPVSTPLLFQRSM